MFEGKCLISLAFEVDLASVSLELNTGSGNNVYTGNNVYNGSNLLVKNFIRYENILLNMNLLISLFKKMKAEKAAYSIAK